jgi:hypothetical protein
VLRSTLWGICLLAMLAIITAGLPAAVAGVGADPFKGSWSAIDIDGSRMTLSFAGSGPTRSVTWFEERATCLDGAAYTVTAIGTISDSTISGTFGEICGAEASFAITHDPSSNTLSFVDVVWMRGDAGPDAFNGVWVATDLDGSAMQLTLDGDGLSRDVAFHDHGATACGPVVDGEGVDYSAVGTGTIGSSPGLGRFLFASLVGGCAGTAKDTQTAMTFEYLYLANQLLDDAGVVWSRRG